MSKIKEIIDSMSVEEKVGQLFQIGFTGTVVTDEIKEMIVKYKVGNIIYFARNIESPEQVRSMSRELQRTAKEADPGLPLLISTDQEGGIVTRLKGVTHFPGNMALGATRSKELARLAGERAAREINWMLIITPTIRLLVSALSGKTLSLLLNWVFPLLPLCRVRVLWPVVNTFPVMVILILIPTWLCR